MIENFKDCQYYQREEEEKNDNIKKENPSSTFDLKVIEESEENMKNKEEENLSEEESLGYNSNYKIFPNNIIIKDNQGFKDKIYKRKASNLSTTISQTDTFSETNSFLPPNNNKSQNNDRKTSYTQPSHIFFGRERLNSTPITTYFEGMDFYLRGLHPEKNDYQKTNNYIEKEIFFNEKNISFKDMKYKSFDLSEQKRFNSHQILKNKEENYQNSTDNKMQASLPLQISLENNPQNQNNINSNYQNTFIPITPKFNNYMYGKFDMPLYYFGYYNIDSKYINYIFTFLFSVKWNANNTSCTKEYRFQK